ncbi:MAG: hypothetical protein IT170_11725 [Bryobacterales bacterium]|nr:hypothetical protein [Bryobacterales bacterium]
MNESDELSEMENLAQSVADRLMLNLNLNLASGSPQSRPSANSSIDRLTQGTLRVAGVEFTQSTQFNGSSGASYGPDNGVPLVAYKTLVTRVYPSVQPGLLGDTLTGKRVTGQLTLSIGDRVIYQTGPTRSIGARVGPAAKIDRSAWDQELTVSLPGRNSVALKPLIANCTLNFLIPAYFCKPGRIYASVILWPVEDGPSSSHTARTAQYLQFLNVEAPKVCLVRVNWVDSKGNVTSPTDASMLGTTALASRMLPFPYFETTILGIEVTSRSPFAQLPAQAGGCNTSWQKLIADLNVTRIFTALFGLGDIVFGMVPQAAIPAGTTRLNAGCGSGAGGGFVGYNPTFAHEIGHLYECSHVAVAGDSSSDPLYPNYGGSKTSIGEVGIDTGTSPPTLYDPAVSDDIMSYGNNQWISPYTYQNILNRRSLHKSTPIDPHRLRPVLVLDFRVYREVQGVRHASVRRALRLDAAGPAPTPPPRGVSPISLDLLDANNRILATHHCTWAATHGMGKCGCGCAGADVPLEREPWLDFQEVVEWPAEEVRSVAFHRGAEPFHRIEVGEAPVVSVEGPELNHADLVLSIKTSHPREAVSVLVLLTSDDGGTWLPVALDPPNGQVKIPIDRLPGGDHCFFRAIATAELQSASADSGHFRLPQKRQKLILCLPNPDCPVHDGAVTLTAHIDARGLGGVHPKEVRWVSNLDGELGFGFVLNTQLSPGRHELTVTADLGHGNGISERGIIIVGG